MLDYKTFCRAAYKRCVDQMDIPLDLRVALRSSERVPTFIDNLAAEIDKAQAMRLRQHKPIFRDQTIESLISDMVQVFISGIKIEAERRMESDIAKTMREQRQDQIKDMESTEAGVIAGDYQEFLTTEADLNAKG